MKKNSVESQLDKKLITVKVLLVCCAIPFQTDLKAQLLPHAYPESAATAAPTSLSIPPMVAQLESTF